jgi:hypothetical protein
MLRLCLERLGEGLAARRAVCEAETTAERLEIALAETATRGDGATAELITARQEALQFEDQLRTSAAEATAARQEALQFKDQLRTSAAEATAARQEALQSKDQLRTSAAEATAARQEARQFFKDQLRTSAAEATAARQEALQFKDQLRTSAAEAAAARQEALQFKDQLRTSAAEATSLTEELQIVSAQLTQAESRTAAEHARSVDAEARLTTVLGSTSWRLTQPLRRSFDHRPGLARLLRRAIRLAWWTVTFQLLARYRLRRRTRARAAANVDPSPEPLTSPVFASPATLGPAPERIDTIERFVGPTESEFIFGATIGRLDALERRAGAMESLVEMERYRIDWALGEIEGVTAAIDTYHAYRETDEYLSAFDTTAPLVSVCVATMDRANLLLERSIASLLAQSYHNIQVIVVGDSCTDDTACRLAALHDDRIQFTNLPERGPYPSPGLDRWYVAGSNAMNHALSLCEGQFITHLDDDDAMVPHRIESMVAAALTTRTDFLWHPLWCENSDGTWVRLGNGRLELGQVSTGSIFYHRYFARFPWDVRAYRLREPGDWNRLRKIKLLRPRIHYVDEPLVYHYAEQSQGSFTARDGERFLE